MLVVQHVSFLLIDSVNNKWSISLYLKKDYDKNSVDVVNLINSIKNIGDEIDISYRDKEDALEEVRRRTPDLAEILERTNPLPATIKLSNIHIDKYKEINYVVEWKMFLFDTWEKTEEAKNSYFWTYAAQYKNIVGVTTYLQILQIVLYIVVAMLLLSIGIIIYSIIGNFVFYYRDEIYITRLVWWSKVFIYGPFSLQGMMYAALGFLFWLGLFYSGVHITNSLLTESYTLSFILWEYQLIFLLEFLVFIFIWGVSWLISSRKYLK